MTDLLVDSNNDLIVENGDFVVGEADQQHMESIIISSKGDWKQHPLVGVGINQYTNAPLTRIIKTELEKEMRLQLEVDGFKNIGITINDWTDIDITAKK